MRILCKVVELNTTGTKKIRCFRVGLYEIICIRANSRFPPWFATISDHLLFTIKQSAMLNFHLRYFISRFKTEVLTVDPIGDTGRWKIATRVIGSEEVITTEFDAVMICVGHHANPIIPPLPGLQQFAGTVLHTRDFKDTSIFSGKNAVVVGIGNSGIDATADLSRVTKQVGNAMSNGRGRPILF